MMDSPRTQSPLRDFESSPFAQQHIRRRNSHILKFNFRVAVGRVIVTVNAEHPHDFQPRRIHRHQNHGLLLMWRRRGIGLPHENGNLAARIARARRPPLPSIDHILVAALYDARADVGCVRGRHVWLGHRKTRSNFSRKQRCEPFFFLLDRSVARQHFHISRIRRGAIKNFRGHMAAPHDFAQRRVFQVRQARASLIIGQKQIPQAGCASFDLQFFDDPGRLPPVVFDFVMEALLVGINMRIHEFLQAALHSLSFLVEFEAHDLRYFPVNAGGRFCRKCATPPLKSCDFRLSSISCSAIVKASPSGWNIASYTCFLITRNERGLTFDAKSLAYSFTFAKNPSCPNTWFVKPIRKASAASTMRAEKSRSSAFAWPINRGNIQASPYSAMSPRRANAVLNFALSDANRMSQYKAITKPSPTTGPLIAAITGF